MRNIGKVLICLTWFTVSMTSEQFLFVRDIEQAVAARQLRFFYKYTALFHHKMVAKTKTE